MRSPPVSSKARLAALRIDWPSAASRPVSGTSTATRLRVSSAGRRGLTAGSLGLEHRLGRRAAACGAARAARSRRSRPTASARQRQRSSQRPATACGRRDSDAMTCVPMNDKLEPGLYIVATPIGNLSDLSPRAADDPGARRPDRGRGQPRHRQIAPPYRREAADGALSRSQCRQGPPRPDRADGGRGGRAGLRRRHAAHLRSRLQTGPRRPRGRHRRSPPSPAPARSSPP